MTVKTGTWTENNTMLQLLKKEEKENKRKHPCQRHRTLKNAEYVESIHWSNIKRDTYAGRRGSISRPTDR